MEAGNEIIRIVQDHSAMESSLLVIMEALETGVWPKNFVMYRDPWLEDVMEKIALLASEKYGISVPEE